MADGAGPVNGGNQHVVERQTLSGWLFGTRAGWLTLWAVVAGVLLTMPLLMPLFGLASVINDTTRWYYLAATVILWLPLLLLALDPEETVASGPRILLPVLTTVMLATLTGLAVADQIAGTGHLTRAPQQVAFFAFLLLSFIPRIWNAALFAYHRAEIARRPNARPVRVPQYPDRQSGM